MAVADLPGYRYVQAKGYSPGRPDGPPLWIVWHTMEVDELPDRAENTATYFAHPGDGRDVSSHWCVDNNSAVQCVLEKDSAWTVGNRAGNLRGVNIELAGRAAQSRAQWLDPYSLALFNQAARVVAGSMTRWGIPNRWCADADLRAYRGGHTTHADLGRIFGGSDHTDPGRGFPRDHVLAVVAVALAPKPTPTTPPPGGDDMDPYSRWALHVANYRLEGVQNLRDPIVIPEFDDGVTVHPETTEPNPLAHLLQTVLNTVVGLGDRPPVVVAPIDVDKVRAVLLDLLTPPAGG